MNTKLTLRMDAELVKKAKNEAHRRGKSVSQMVGEFFDSLGTSKGNEETLPPVTHGLLGILKGRPVDESAYKKHLREKHL